MQTEAVGDFACFCYAARYRSIYVTRFRLTLSIHVMYRVFSLAPITLRQAMFGSSRVSRDRFKRIDAELCFIEMDSTPPPVAFSRSTVIGRCAAHECRRAYRQQ